jgi:hypothetical protein
MPSSGYHCRVYWRQEPHGDTNEIERRNGFHINFTSVTATQRYSSALLRSINGPGSGNRCSEIGETRLAVSLHDAEDNLANGDEFQSLNFAVEQVIASLGTELYAAYSNVNLTRTAVSAIQDIDVITMGFRLNF